MAKARNVALPGGEDELQVWLRQLFSVRFGEVLSFREAALDPDRTDGIHSMRVAIRRLRSLLGDLKLIGAGPRSASLTRELKLLADKLGAVRDADVGVNSLLKFRAKADDPEVAKGIDAFIERLRSSRQEAFLALEPHLTTERMEHLQSFADRFLRKMSTPRSAADDLILEAAESVIRTRIDEFCSLAPALYSPFRVRRLHKLRIAGKHLRYAVEIFTDQTDEAWSGRASEIAKMQGHLGELHDCDGWISTLRKNLKDYVKSAGEATPEILAAEWLLGEFVRRRAKYYREALNLWAEWRDNKFLEALLKRDDLQPEQEALHKTTIDRE